MIYFDHASSTYIDNDILTTYHKLLSLEFANPSSAHALSLNLNKIVNESRTRILNSFNYKDGKVIFTTGATEANNLFLKGAYHQYKNRGNKIIISAGEHASCTETASYLASLEGANVVFIPLLADGTVNLEILSKEIDNETIIVSVIAVGNENGAINDLETISKMVRKYPKIIFHSDVTQALGKIVLNYDLLDAFSFSAHKIHGLKGSGALVLRKKINLSPLFHGGGQEDGLRSGTNNAPLNIILAKTVNNSFKNIDDNFQKVNVLNKKLVDFLLSYPQYYILNSVNGSPYIVNFSLVKHKAGVFVTALSNEEIYVSIKSSCSDKSASYSPVLLAQTGDKRRATETLRVSFASTNTIVEVEVLTKTLYKLCQEIKDGF